MPDLPGSLRPTSTFPFVGRAPELERLRTLMPRAEGEGRRVVLLGGEPGSGKSRLVREFAAEVARDGALVLYGACDAVVRTPYGPFVEALDHLARTADPAELRAALGTGGGELTRLLPDLPARIGELPPPVAADPDTERHRLHTAVTDLLTGITRDRPALLVLEDGHWADAPTLMLLRHLTRAAGHARVLVLATFRDTEADVTEALSETLADLRRSDDVVRLHLGGLSGNEVAEFVRSAAGSEPAPSCRELAQAIHDLTEGNPFLVCELWRDLRRDRSGRDRRRTIRLAGRRPSSSPESVREVVSQRLCPPRARNDRTCSSSPPPPGSEFELDVVRRAAGLGEPELLAALDEAVRSGMLEELPRTGSRTASRTSSCGGRCTTGCRGCAARSSICASATRSKAPAERSGRALADLAHHFAAAAPFGGPSAARRVQPARRARGLRGARVRRGGGAAANRARAGNRRRRRSGQRSSRARLRVATAAGRRSMRSRRSRRRRSIARELADAELLARAAIGYEDACWRPGMADQGAVELLEEAARRSATATRRCASGSSAGSRARSTSRATTSAARSSARTRSRMARQLGRSRRARHRPDALVLVARGEPLEEILEMLTESRTSARSSATPRSGPRRWRGARRPSSRSATSSPRGARSPRCARRRSRPRSPSCSTWPSTTARRSRSATGASRRPRRWPCARTSGAGC